MKTLLFKLQIILLLGLASCNWQSSKTKTKNVLNTLDTADLQKGYVLKSIKGDKSSINLIKEILVSSPRYQQIIKGLTASIIKNGGDSFGIILQGSPRPYNDHAWVYSRNYELTIYELYPERRLGRAYFVFKPDVKQLYEMDMATQKMVAVDFDRTLLARFDSIPNDDN